MSETVPELEAVFDRMKGVARKLTNAECIGFATGADGIPYIHLYNPPRALTDSFGVAERKRIGEYIQFSKMIDGVKILWLVAEAEA